MFSDVIKSALEQEVVGQARAVNSVVRGVTRLVSGLTPQERSHSAFMFMGPPGTGKTHLIETLARVLHGKEKRLIVADCTHFVHGDPWTAFVGQLAPLFSAPWSSGNKWEVLEAPPLSIIRVEYLERGPQEVYKAMAAALETGQVMLPEGRRGSLKNCLIFFTSGLCAREILDEAPRIGFTGSQEGEEDTEQNRIYTLCLDKAKEHFGTDLVGRLDNLITFHRLEEEHLSDILDRRVVRLNHWLEPRGFRCKLLPEAKSFLLGRGRRDLQLGARDLVRAHQRFVEFPVADLMISGRIPQSGLVVADRKLGEEHLHFTISGQPDDPTASKPLVREVPVGV